MLSYRHAFHAGNHADVLKHLLLVHTLGYLNQKDKPWLYLDTHAGSGRYDLERGEAARLAEWEGGIGRLWDRRDLPSALADYLTLVKDLNPSGALRRYPGSPLIAWRLAREQDQLRLFELHAGDAQQLRRSIKDGSRQVRIATADGFDAVRADLPPAGRRGLVLLDPSYEVKSDYRRVEEALREGLRRFPTGIFMVWHPLLQRPESRDLPARLRRLAAGHWLHATLSVQAPAPGGFGMHGSGVLMVNPPWVLPELLREVLPVLVRLLGRDARAGFTLERSES